jgi:hypothetical protein
MALYRVGFTEFDVAGHLVHHAGGLVNLFGLLIGFELLADHLERSRLPQVLPGLLPDDWKGPLALLGIVFVLSAFLDNIAAAVIGGRIATSLFRGRVHIGYLASIVACANAGGAGSVIGDTTTTMMWIAGISPLAVLPAYIAAVPALVVTGLAGSLQQDRHQRIARDAPAGAGVDRVRLGVVAGVLGVLMTTNAAANLLVPAWAETIPFLATGLWISLFVGGWIRPTSWHHVPKATRGALFLVSLVLAASMVPIAGLPAPSVTTTAGLGFLSAVFDNIPLTALALRQGGYDWAALAFAVGFGGSMVWFGSSAGVALSTDFPEARSTVAWVRHGWHVPLAYVLGGATMWLTRGWVPG